MSSKLSPSIIQKLTGTKETITVEPTHMQLDDFLELDKCTWTRLMIIITSSYGVGQAPLGCYRYRDLSDAWYEDMQNDKQHQGVLDGLSFAMCGLGDSKFTTFFQNPKRIDEAMHLVGAKRVGPLGKADASGTGEELQSKVIQDWIENIWPHLAKVVVEPPLSEERLKEMQLATVKVCQIINPDFEFDDGTGKGKNSSLMPTYSLALLVALLAIILYNCREFGFPRE